MSNENLYLANETELEQESSDISNNQELKESQGESNTFKGALPTPPPPPEPKQ